SKLSARASNLSTFITNKDTQDFYFFNESFMPPINYYRKILLYLFEKEYKIFKYLIMELTHIADRGRWLAVNDEVQIGELIYRVEDNVMTIYDVEVDAYYRGNKNPEHLVLAAIHHARDNDCKVGPACSRAKPVFERYPAEQDVS